MAGRPEVSGELLDPPVLALGEPSIAGLPAVLHPRRWLRPLIAATLVAGTTTGNGLLRVALFAAALISAITIAIAKESSKRNGAGPRMIPGLGMSTRPPLLDQSFVDEVVHVEEADTVRACHRMARSGFLFGGSTGTVVSGATRWLAQHDTRQLTAVAIAPDLGKRYLDTIYQTNWLVDVIGEDVLTSDGLATDSPAA